MAPMVYPNTYQNQNPQSETLETEQDTVYNYPRPVKGKGLQRSQLTYN